MLDAMSCFRLRNLTLEESKNVEILNNTPVVWNRDGNTEAETIRLLYEEMMD
jgi:hypothetical protein